MKHFLAIFIILHGIIHLMGFVKAFGLAPVNELHSEISKFNGIFWLMAGLLLIISAILLWSGNSSVMWIYAAVSGVILSIILISGYWADAKWGMIPNLIILIFAILGYATATYFQRYEADVQEQLNNSNQIKESVLTENDIKDLPVLVQKYIRYSGSVGKPKVNNFKVIFQGKIRKNAQSDWMTFTSEQFNFLETSTRLFFMNAEFKHIPIAGYHRFLNGDAFMDIRLLSLFKIQFQTGREMGIAETVTFFNDMCCMAPATLTDKRIKWLETDSTRVKAEFTNHNITISAWLYFNEMGELINFISEDRYAATDEHKMKRYRWATPMKNYKEINGRRLPSYAEVIYTYPEGDFCYGTFENPIVEYNCISKR